MNTTGALLLTISLLGFILIGCGGDSASNPIDTTPRNTTEADLTTAEKQRESMKSPIAYDKAEYHFDSVEENNLTEIHAYTHTAMYIGWLIDYNLLDKQFAQDFYKDINDFKNRKITAPELFTLWDGAFLDDMLNDEGNKFSKYYFDFENGEYINDYEKNLANGLSSIFHVDNTWENYEKSKAFISERYEEWKRIQ